MRSVPSHQVMPSLPAPIYEILLQPGLVLEALTHGVHRKWIKAIVHDLIVFLQESQPHITEPLSGLLLLGAHTNTDVSRCFSKRLHHFYNLHSFQMFISILYLPCLTPFLFVRACACACACLVVFVCFSIRSAPGV